MTELKQDEITRQDFISFEKVRQSGITNMMSPDVQTLAGIDRLTHMSIIKHYDYLNEKWPEVRE